MCFAVCAVTLRLVLGFPQLSVVQQVNTRIQAGIKKNIIDAVISNVILAQQTESHSFAKYKNKVGMWSVEQNIQSNRLMASFSF